MKMIARHGVLIVFNSLVRLMMLNMYASYATDAFSWQHGENITCFCNNKDWNGHPHRRCINNRCTSTSRLTVCYTSLADGDERRLEKGCTFIIYCESSSKAKKNARMECCWESMCNQFVNGTHLAQPTKLMANEKARTKKSFQISKDIIVVIVAIPLSLIIIGLTVVLMCKHFRKSNDTYRSSFLRPKDSELYLNEVNPSSTGSGAGLPLLSHQTIANQIFLKECVSKGKFGTVYRGVWHDVDVAVKVFSTGEETSWFCEREIYQTTMLRHENILGFIAADSKDTGVCTEYWLVCEYHPKGSLYNYLQTEVLDVYDMLKMALSIANGLNHLHMQIVGNQAKPPIAHRDIKTKNILVKCDNTCCIGDLGLAVTKTSVIQGAVNSSRTGTRRYHSPELLNNTMDSSHFGSYLKADIYALGLCLWEACWRTEVHGEAPEYQLPYFDQVPMNSLEEDMFRVICVNQQRPRFSDQWKHSTVMKAMMKLMEECWCTDASARLPILRIRKNIISLCRTIDVPL